MLPEAAARAYTQALESTLEGLGEAERSARRASLAAFIGSGFPDKRQEDWRYTDLAGLAAQAFGTAPDAAPDLGPHAIPGAQRLAFVNGRRRATARDVPDERLADPAPPAARDGNSLESLTAALAREGAFISIPAGEAPADPIHVLCVTAAGAAPAMVHMRHSIHLGRGAAATVVFEDLSPAGGPHLLTQACHIRLEPGANLELVRIQHHGPGVQVLSRWSADVGRDAGLRWTNLDLGGTLVRSDLAVALSAPGASVELAGVYALDGDSHTDNHTRIDHLATDGRSRQRYRGIVDGKARAIFNGRIVVHPDAARTDSDQQVANLLLSPTAEVNAKPELQIDNDDVRCAHGATCGQLDADAVYYLRSRGLPPDTARQLLLFSFADAVLGKVASETARRRLHQHLVARLPGGSTLTELL